MAGFHEPYHHRRTLRVDSLLRATFIVFRPIVRTRTRTKEHPMKAVRIHDFGGPEVLKYEDIPDPVLRKDHVLVRVRACALNHLDLWVRKGLPGVKLPHILGSDIAGEIVECGQYITDLNEGTRVLLAPMVFCNHCEQC